MYGTKMCPLCYVIQYTYKYMYFNVLFLRRHDPSFAILIIFPHWHGAGGWNPSSRKIRTMGHLSKTSSLIYDLTFWWVISHKFNIDVTVCMGYPHAEWFHGSDISWTPHDQYHGCWWPGDSRSQGISSHGMELVIADCFSLSTRGIQTFAWGHGNLGRAWLHARVRSAVLTHWGRVTHICVSKLSTIGSDNGLSPERHQAIIWNNAGILLIWTLGTKFNEILIESHTFSFKNIHLKISSGKWRPFCLGLNMLTGHSQNLRHWMC